MITFTLFSLLFYNSIKVTQSNKRSNMLVYTQGRRYSIFRGSNEPPEFQKKKKKKKELYI